MLHAIYVRRDEVHIGPMCTIVFTNSRANNLQLFAFLAVQQDGRVGTVEVVLQTTKNINIRLIKCHCALIGRGTGIVSNNSGMFVFKKHRNDGGNRVGSRQSEQFCVGRHNRGSRHTLSSSPARRRDAGFNGDIAPVVDKILL